MRSDAWKEGRTESARIVAERAITIEEVERAVIEAAEAYVIDPNAANTMRLGIAVAHLRSVRESK